ncbi:unnamed protein product [Citrullus colocynthis]|uniref:Uncharacterized protein n=1 Tax=Citrullus colocynthis TaxID=252529 RepID=A0ABP0Z3I3_9ROSI
MDSASASAAASSAAAAAAAGNHVAARQSASAAEVSAAAALVSSDVVAGIAPGTPIAALALASANSARHSALLAVHAANMVAPGAANVVKQQY